MIRAVALLALLAGTAHADGTTETFLGWAQDGNFYATVYKNAAGEFGSVCKAGPTAGATWPKDYGYPQGGSTCVSGLHVPRAELAQLVMAAQPVAGSKPTPRGLTLAFKLEKIDDFVTGVLTVSGGKPKRSVTFRYEEGMEDAKLGEVFWQPGETAVAFYLTSKSGRAVYHEDLTQLVSPAPGPDAPPPIPESAAVANTEGQAALKAREWSKALDAFRRAVKLDPTMVVAHVNLARAAARTRTFDDMMNELTWLRTSSQSSARSHLKHLFNEPAFDAYATDKEVRALFGLLPWSKLSPIEQLMERRSEWSTYGVECARPLVTLTFKKDGRVHVRYREACDKRHIDRSSDGLYASLPADTTFPGTKAKGPVVVSVKPIREWPKLPDSAWIAWCPDRFRGDAPCFTLHGPSYKEIGDFYGYEPEMKPAAH